MKRYLNLGWLTFLLLIIGTVIAVWSWWADIHAHSLHLRVASQVLLQPATSDAINGLEVSIDGVPIKTPYLTVLELSNDGRKPITATDFHLPLEVWVAEGSTIARAQLTYTSPKDIDVELSWDPQSIKIKPLLLNSEDVLTISVLTSGGKPEFSPRARIAGISKISIGEKEEKPSSIWLLPMLLLIVFLLSVASDLTNTSFTSTEPIVLRKRAAVLISSCTGMVALVLFMAWLDYAGITRWWSVALAAIAIVVLSTFFSMYWNRSAKALSSELMPKE